MRAPNNTSVPRLLTIFMIIWVVINAFTNLIITPSDAKVTVYLRNTSFPVFQTQRNRDFLHFNPPNSYNITGLFITPIWKPAGNDTNSVCRIQTFSPPLPLIVSIAATPPPLIIYISWIKATESGCYQFQYAIEAIDEALSNISTNTSLLPNTTTRGNKTLQPYRNIPVVAIFPSMQYESKNKDWGGMYGEAYGGDIELKYKKVVNKVYWTLLAREDAETISKTLANLSSIIPRTGGGGGGGGANNGTVSTPFGTISPNSLFIATVSQSNNPWNEVLDSTGFTVYKYFLVAIYSLTIIYAIYEIVNVVRRREDIFNLRLVLYITSMIYFIVSIIFLTVDLPWIAQNVLYWSIWLLGCVSYSLLLWKWADIVSRVQNVVFITGPSEPKGKMSSCYAKTIDPIWQRVSGFLSSGKFYRCYVVFVPLNLIVIVIIILIGACSYNTRNVTLDQLRFKSKTIDIALDMLLYEWPVVLFIQAVMFAYYGTRMLTNLRLVSSDQKRGVIRKITILTLLSAIGFFLDALNLALIATRSIDRSVSGYVALVVVRDICGYVLFGFILAALAMRTKPRKNISKPDKLKKVKSFLSTERSKNSKNGNVQQKSIYPHEQTGSFAVVSKRVVLSLNQGQTDSVYSSESDDDDDAIKEETVMSNAQTQPTVPQRTVFTHRTNLLNVLRRTESDLPDSLPPMTNTNFNYAIPAPYPYRLPIGNIEPAESLFDTLPVSARTREATAMSFGVREGLLIDVEGEGDEKPELLQPALRKI